MLSTTRLNHRKLQHLHNASQCLFPASPAVSAHLASKMTSFAGATGIQLADSTWRKTCACCGYAMVPGWTVTVRARGIADPVNPPDDRQGRPSSRRDEARTKASEDVSQPADDTATRPSGAHGRVATGLSRPIRKRGKRTRGRKRAAGSSVSGTEQGKPKGSHAALEPEVRLPAQAGALSSIPASQPLGTRPVSGRKAIAPKEPRMIYACKICDRKTIHALPMAKPAAVAVAGEQAVPQTVRKPGEVTVLGTRAVEQPEAVAPSVPSSTNTTAKKRAKSRKSTLSEMLAKEQANRSAASSAAGAGFGLDLMDFMRTS